MLEMCADIISEEGILNRSNVLQPLVSIITPVYNVADYLPRCIESICHQSYENLEILLIDDGSRDQSGWICDQYSQIDTRIRVIHQKNGGLSSARNTGIKAALGEYVAFIDSDDFISNQFIERLLKLALAYKAEISICGYYEGRSSTFPVCPKAEKIQVYTSKEMLQEWHGTNKHIETIACNKLYLKELFKDEKMRYPKGYYHEDVQLTHLLVNEAKQIVITSERLYYYFRRKGSITANWTKKRVDDCIEGQNKRIEFFRMQGYTAACERLMVKRLKYYILMYFKIHNKSIKENLWKQFVIHRYEVNVSKVWERVMFYVFEKLFRIKEGK